jgi:hypothetical protein
MERKNIKSPLKAKIKYFRSRLSFQIKKYLANFVQFSQKNQKRGQINFNFFFILFQITSNERVAKKLC